MTTRIVSGLVLLFLLIITLVLGPKFSTLIITLIGILTVDEINLHFFRITRKSWSYFLSILTFLVIFIPLYISNRFENIDFYLVSFGVLVNLMLVFYLFFIPAESKFPKNLTFLATAAGLVIGVQLYSLATIISKENWKLWMILILLLNYGMDTCAWFFGKNFGKHKLWPKVSPNKTVEGLIGGAIGATFIAGFYWYMMDQVVGIFPIFCFAFWAFCSQVGDLIESKLKRHFGIKDSSGLIPGHGGIYDRIDSLLFLAPVFASTLRFFYN